MAKATSYTIAFDAPISAPTITFDKPTGKVLVIWTYDRDGTKAYARPIGAFKHVSCKDVLGKTYPCLYADGRLSMVLAESTGPGRRYRTEIAFQDRPSILAYHICADQRSFAGPGMRFV